MVFRLFATLAALVLLNVALPEPVMFDALGVGLSWVGLDLVLGGEIGL